MTRAVEDAAVARRLLRQSRHGALATLMAAGGTPYSSLVAVASLPDGMPVLLISRLAVHTRNLLADPRVSLLISETGAGDPLQHPRIMVAASAELLAGGEVAVAKRRYLRAHPDAALYADFPDFLFVRLRPSAVHLVAGFGRISDLEPTALLTDISDATALLEAEEGAVAHMNADHADALHLYATQLCGTPAANWRCTGLDPDGIDLAADGLTLRLDFPERVTDPVALRKMLAALAAKARALATSN